ncbi:ATP-dependent DNA helicase UvrD [Nitrosomonas sp. PY1]|uniref:UvrD-helicase domain-containing protein n=1 Tax=Nitrosomonas sp. PY1 TaxID=1803906 RepID=UPI001FC893BF|nr:UvrD-helicase domain-containing protein [Nitrosomonas sp. PY1]GKS69327.1 ATP-dependent DNA helicase UvrD [Nitrosomonas sp. PY1]
MSSLLSDLNPQQLEAITLPHQSALVLAGAGSGKTRVLTTRIAYLVQTGQASPHSVFAVTFTNKAAKEMLARITAMLPINPKGMWIGTFHGLSHRLLRTHFQDAGLPQAFQILDASDQLAFIKRLMKDLSVDEKKIAPRQLQWFINNAKEAGLRAAFVTVDDTFSSRLLELYQVYEQQCYKAGVVDFAELLLRSYELLQRNQILCAHYRERFRHILIDEFQDTNTLQYQWIKLLAGVQAAQGVGAAVFAVGDDDQSIYAFRGANTGNMKEFERDFNISKIIKLEQNYRSHGNILDAANALIGNNANRLGKNLWTEEGKGEPVRAYNALSDFDEAAFVVDEVRALRAEGIALYDMALLYRSNAQSRILEHSLFNAAIPYRVYGGMRFFDRQEIKHALAYLRLIANPEDDNALLRVINFPARGIGTRSLEQLQAMAKVNGISLWAAAVQQSGGQDSLMLQEGSKKTLKGIAGFVQRIVALRERCATLLLPQIVEQMLNSSELITHYAKEREGAERLENLKELVNAATSFVHETGNDSLTEFLAHASLEAGEHQAGSGQDALQLMTVHAAKGLEFHTVFLSGLEEGLFPHENSLNENDGISEERRLMYVAMTRARRRLHLSFAQSRMLHGQTRYNVVSRFLHEIPEDCIKWLQSQPAINTFNSKAGNTKPKEWSRSTINDLSTYPWRMGEKVVHAKFGIGIIVNFEGTGNDMRVQVNFENSGIKWLLVEYAKLVTI